MYVKLKKRTQLCCSKVIKLQLSELNVSIRKHIYCSGTKTPKLTERVTTTKQNTTEAQNKKMREKK